MAIGSPVMALCQGNKNSTSDVGDGISHDEGEKKS
jgi:hypothetical protein